MACSFLLLNGSKLNCQDEDGMTPLHLATEAGHTGQVCLLLRYKADQSLCDKEGRTPLDMAVSHANADIVTLLRLTKLNEEMRESEMASNDDTYNEVNKPVNDEGTESFGDYSCGGETSDAVISDVPSTRCTMSTDYPPYILDA
ncbi:arf-GAP with coiled-coil ANK repeat and PH domain-containing protein 2 [Danaus plexippus plexippus]|uniref:Arf-GAP with coiled-coil ANK repeat and PH domain-containing protein 2 n=1 Tax=Danaus plexippus plexippus TaxID=278856 RepID=A0A212EZU5_DANPL|nr:arf-GAP with coiled-coil ANK repeat and PH domain-containing protein 2 [Danaus plexippus plexippus]